MYFSDVLVNRVSSNAPCDTLRIADVNVKLDLANGFAVDLTLWLISLGHWYPEFQNRLRTTIALTSYESLRLAMVLRPQAQVVQVPNQTLHLFYGSR